MPFGVLRGGGLFSLVVNLLQLVPTIYMLQLYDRVVPTGNLYTLLMLTVIVMVLFATLGLLKWVRSQILVRVSSRLETLLNDRLFQVSFKQALYSGGQRAIAQPLDDLTALRQFLTGQGLFAFFDAPWLPVYIAVMFIFHVWYGWAAILWLLNCFDLRTWLHPKIKATMIGPKCSWIAITRFAGIRGRNDFHLIGIGMLFGAKMFRTTNHNTDVLR